MKIVLAAVGKTTTAQYLRTGIDMYLDRLKHYTSVQICIIPDIKTHKTISQISSKNAKGAAPARMLQPGDKLLTT